MLLQFVVENFLSFRDKAVLSMLAADGVDHDEAHCVRLPGLPPVLRCAAVYGANASGKSNLIKALDFARKLVVGGTRAGEEIPLRRFKLAPASLSAPTRFEVDLHAGGRRYSYGFVATTEAIESEWLFADEEELLFQRERREGAERPEIELGAALTEDRARRQFLEFVAEGTRPNQLFLTEVAEHNVGELSAVTGWFRSGAVVLRPGLLDLTPALWQRLEESTAFRDYLGEMLESAGTGVTRVESKAQDKRGFAGFIQELNRTDPREGSHRLPEDSSVKFLHVSASGAAIPFAFGEESDGTRRLIGLAPLLFDLRQAANGTPVVHIIDELDRSLHPLLTRFFLDAFLRVAPDRPTQILFTTHDTNLLDLNVLSRDSIWFTEKDAGGASALYSLAEFKGDQLVRIGEHLEQGYLQGRFGAIPFLGDPRRLGWSRQGAR